MRVVFGGSRFAVACYRVLFGGALALVACGGASKGSGASDASDAGSLSSEEMKAQFDREAEPIEKQVVRLDGGFTAYIEANSAPKLEPEGKGLKVTADLGWESEVTCFVYGDVIDAGTAAHAILKAAAKDVQFKALAAYFVDHVALDPIFGIRGVYHVERNGTLLAGDLKLMVMSRSEYPVICWHDAPGYAKSFARVASDFGKSFQFKSEQTKPMRGELWTVNLDGTPVGFSRDTTYALEGGNVRRVSLSARFLPTGPGEMSFEDEAEIVTTDKDGALVTGKYLSIENGEQSLAIDVERTKAGYNYVGTIQNKEVKGSFKSKQPIKAQYATEKKLRSLAQAGKKSKFEQWEYVPGLDAASASKVSYEVTAEGDGMTIVSSMGRRGATLKANSRGVVKQAVMAVGSKKVQVDLVEEAGEL